MRIKTHWNNDLYQICAVSLSTSWLSLLVLGDKLYYLSEVVLDGYERRMIMDDQVRSITSCLRTFQHLNSFGQSGAEEQNCHQHFLIFNLFLDQLCIKLWDLPPLLSSGKVLSSLLSVRWEWVLHSNCKQSLWYTLINARVTSDDHTIQQAQASSWTPRR